MSQVQYTFTFDTPDEKKFREIRSRLDPDEYSVVEDIADFDNPERKSWESPQKRTVMVMDPEAASTFRFGMKKLTIRRLRTEEEEEAERKEKEENTIRINVVVPQNPGNGHVPGV
jgi:hypothetical protein